MVTLCAQLLLLFYADSFEIHMCVCHGLKMCMWLDIFFKLFSFLSLFLQFELSLFHTLLLSTYVDSRYLERVPPPINFTFSDDSLFLSKSLGGGHKFSEFVSSSSGCLGWATLFYCGTP